MHTICKLSLDYIAKRRKFIVSKMQGLVLLVQKPCTFEA